MIPGRPVVMVGGHLHGRVHVLVRSLVTVGGPLLPVERYVWSFPGRTDRQVVDVCIIGDRSEVEDALLVAWAKGWAPDDEASDRSADATMTTHFHGQQGRPT